jgi:DNA-binding NarL/FixJ family response regulator
MDKISIITETLKQQYELSERETEVTYYLARGYTNKEIAQKLYVTEKTVKQHVWHIFAKTKFESRYKLQGEVVKLLCTPIGEW